MIRVSLAIPSNQAHVGLLFAFTAWTLLAARIVVAAERSSYDQLQNQAKLAYVNGKREEAVMLVTEAIAIEPKNPLG